MTKVFIHLIDIKSLSIIMCTLNLQDSYCKDCDCVGYQKCIPLFRYSFRSIVLFMEMVGQQFVTRLHTLVSGKNYYMFSGKRR